MKTILRDETSGVSEVLGTILILAMTVTLFSTVILWVSAFPAPTAATHADIGPSMEPIYDGSGLVVGVNITLTHLGGDSLLPGSTILYVADQRGSGPTSTDVATLHPFTAALANPSGLVDGSDGVWTTGERWVYLNFGDRPSDNITVTIVDSGRSVVVWTGAMNPAAGTRPPVFLNVWASGTVTAGAPNPVLEGLGFFLYAQVVSPDNDLNPDSVYATITAWYGSGTVCSVPLKMHDDHVFPDLVAGDGIFALGGNVCMNPPFPPRSWSGSYILLNATDYKGHQTQTRFVLNVFTPSGGGGGAGSTIPNQVWQYIGFVQIRTGEVWVSNLTSNYTTTNTYQPYRVRQSWLKNQALFHFKMANHGNTTIFVDGWTEAFFQNTQNGNGFALYLVAPCTPALPASGGGIVKYPGTTTSISDFQYAHAGLPAGCAPSTPPAVFDIDPFDQQTGGTPYVALMSNLIPFATGSPYGWPNPGGAPLTYFISILVSGMAGPVNYTYAQLTQNAGNPYGCSGLGPGYNPALHLNDPIPACRTTYYAQVIPFVGMVVY